MRSRQNPEVLAAAVSMLRIADPELTAAQLLTALENRQTPAAATPPKKMLTLKEFAKLTSLSLPTIFRMIKRQELPTVMLGLRSRRIAADVSERFLNGNVAGRV